MVEIKDDPGLIFSVDGHGDIYTIDSANLSDSSITVSSSMTSPIIGAIGTNYPNAIWTTSGTTTAPWMTSNPTGAKIQLDGDSADITVNGWSLVDAVKRIEERLGLYQPNPELEQEWSELRDLAEQYRKLEQYIKEKQATFDTLKQQPAPEIK